MNHKKELLRGSAAPTLGVSGLLSKALGPRGSYPKPTSGVMQQKMWCDHLYPFKLVPESAVNPLRNLCTADRGYRNLSSEDYLDPPK